VQVSLGTASGQTLSRAAEAVRELLREVLSVYVTAHLPGGDETSPAP
jgi:hypothetical protein